MRLSMYVYEGSYLNTYALKHPPYRSGPALFRVVALAGFSGRDSAL